MSELFEDKDKAVEAEIASLEVEAKKLRMFQSQAFLTHHPFPIEQQLELEELHRRIAELQQKQMSNQLASIHESSNRLEGATRNLQQSSESQVKVAESQVKVSESQARTIDDLLKSSHRLEQFAIYLLVMTAVNIFIVEYTTNLFSGPYGFVGFVGLLVGITAMMAIAFRWPSWIRRKPKIT
jgi:small-conductance mechanosensitive channel